VVDAGTCHGDIQEILFDIADTLYLVTEMTFPSLRNAHRIISFLSAGDRSGHVQVVANRFDSRHGRIDEAGGHGKIDEASATKALTRPVSWRIPNAYVAVRDSQDRGVPVAMQDSPYTRAVVQMARTACGKPPALVRKTGWASNIFGLRRPANPVEI
jgi:Flp pilus assembly CpaE family ATPase